jgi:O-antigen ligase
MPSLAGAARLRIVKDNLLLPIAFFTSPLATSVAPRLTPLCVAIVGIALIGSALRRGMHWRELLPYQTALAACLVFAAYVLLSSTWSADPLAGLGKAALLLGLILFTFAAVRAASALDNMTLSGAAIAFAAGALLGTLFIIVELLTHGIVTRTVVTWLPFLVSRKHFDISGGVITQIHLAKLDQNVNVAMFHLWPGLLALMGLASTRRAIAIVGFFAVIAAVIALSKHDSSQVALIVSSLVVILGWKWRTLVIRSLAVLWCAAFVLVIPANFAAYDNGLHFAEWLPKSARARIILWEYTSEQTLDHPLLGAGVDSTPRLTDQQKAMFGRERPEGFVYPRTMGHHAHSIFLQTWSELGAIGALLLAVAGAAVVLLIFFLPITAQPFAAGAFAAFAIVGAFAWGMWQSWFMCAVALLPLYLRVPAATVEE